MKRTGFGARLHALLFYAAISAAAIVGTIGATILAGRNAEPGVAWLLKCCVVLALVVGITWLYMRKAGMTWARYGVPAESKVSRLALAGLGSGLSLALVWTAVVWLWAPFGLGPNPTFSLRALLLGTLATLAVGVAEEIGYRTYGFECLERSFGALAAVLLPSAVFAAMHMTGGMPLLAAICVVGSCSVLYGVLMLVTRSLPFVAAFHIANNLVQDAFIRTGEGSLFAPTFRSATGFAGQAGRIWLCILVVNLLVAFCIWWKRHSQVGFIRRS